MDVDPSVYFASRTRRTTSGVKGTPLRNASAHSRVQSVGRAPITATDHSHVGFDHGASGVGGAAQAGSSELPDEALEAFAAVLAARGLSTESMQQLAKRAVERAHRIGAPARRARTLRGLPLDASSTSSSLGVVSSGRAASAHSAWSSVSPAPGSPPRSVGATPASLSNLSRSRELPSYTSELLDLRRDEIAAEADRLEEAKAELARERRRLEAAAAEFQHAQHHLTVSLPHNSAARIQAEMRANAARASFAARRATAGRDAEMAAAQRAAAAQARAERQWARARLKLALRLQRIARAQAGRRVAEAMRAARAEEHQRKLVLEGALRRRLGRRERRELEYRAAAAVQAAVRGRSVRTSDAARVRREQLERKAALAARIEWRDAAIQLQRVARGRAGRTAAQVLRRERADAVRVLAATSRFALRERRAATLLQAQIRTRHAAREVDELRLQAERKRRSSVSELRHEMRRRLSAVLIASAWRGWRGRDVARMRRDAAADQEAAVFYRAEGERLRVETLYGPASAGAATGAASRHKSKQPSEPPSLLHWIKSSSAEGGSHSAPNAGGIAQRTFAQRLFSAALLMQSYARRRRAIRLVAPQRRAAREARARRAEERMERRRVAKRIASAKVIQSIVRMRAAKVIVTQRRAVEAGRARAMEAVRKAAAGYLKSVESAADAERRRAKDAAAAMLQGAVRGRKARRHAAVLAALPSDPTVIIHSVAFDGVALSTFHQVREPDHWIHARTPTRAVLVWITAPACSPRFSLTRLSQAHIRACDVTMGCLLRAPQPPSAWYDFSHHRPHF